MAPIARAARDLPGPVYIHCHHGKHRGPAAAAVVRLCLDRQCSVETALEEMRRAGTDPRYTGLYAAPGQFRRPAPGELDASLPDLDAVPADFPEVAEVAALAQVMAGVDERWDNLKRLRAAGWGGSDDHPDLEPAHEAAQLLELFREAGRLPAVQQRPEEFRRWLADAEQNANDLEKVLRRLPGKDVESESGQVFGKLGASCSRCHAKYRDVPQDP
jgi:hypothetical protein